MDFEKHRLAEMFQDFLDRKAPPRSISDNIKAMQAEQDVLMKSFLACRPRVSSDLVSEWAKKSIDAIEISMTTRAWPTAREVREVASEVAKTYRKTEGDGAQSKIDDIALNARRIVAGEPVGEGYLWGVKAVKIEKSGLASRAEIQHRRSQIYFSEKKQYGEATARRIEAERDKKHEAASRAQKSIPAHHMAKLPDLRPHDGEPAQ